MVIPLVVLFGAPLQLFPHPGWVDPGMYLGLALDTFDMVRSYGWNYHVLRVSYVVPRQVLHLLLSAEAAWITGVVLFHLAALFGLYTGARLLWGRAPAAVATLLLACNPAFLQAVTGGYVDGAVTAYLLLLFAGLAAWIRHGGDGWLVAAGVALALAVLGHLMAAVPAGLLLLFAAVLGWERFAARPIATLAAGLAGMVLTFVAFMYAMSEVGFGPRAFEVLRWIVSSAVGGGGAAYRLPLGDWLPGTTRLLPLLLSPLILAILLRLSTRQGRRRDLAALLLGAAAALVLPAYDLLVRGSTTQSPFYAFVTLAPMAIAMTAVAAGLVPADERGRQRAVAGIAVIALASVFLGPFLWRTADRNGIGLTAYAAAALALLVLLAVIVARSRRTGRPAGAGFLLAFGTLVCIAGAVNRDTRSTFLARGATDNREFFRASLFVRDALREAETDGRSPLFWFDRWGFRTLDHRYGTFVRPVRVGDVTLMLNPFDGFAALRLWDRSLLSAELASDENLDLERLFERPRTTLVVMDNGFAGGLEVAREILGAAGVRCRLRWAGVHDSRSFLLRVGLLDVLGRRDGSAARCDSE